MKTLSLVVPCFNEQESIPIFLQKIKEIYEKMKNDLDLEIIFVDDGSKDETLNIIKSFHQEDNRIKYISFSKNFGKEAAIYAGLEKSIGDFVALMDVDLQDPPELLLDMYNGIINKGYDCVATKRTSRKGEPPIRSFFAKCFYKLINKISKTEIVDGARDYRMMTRQMVDSILSLKEYNRFSKGIFSWVGYKTKWLEYENIERVAGQTKWSFWKLLIYSLEGIMAFSTVPLVIASIVGLILFFISILMLFINLVKTSVFGYYASTYYNIINVILLIGGLQILFTGILGQYLSKIYLEIKNRPIYITREESK